MAVSDETRARDHHGVAAARNRVVAMSALVGIPSILVLALGVTGTDRFRAGGWWVWPLVLLGFVAAEWLVFHVEARNETVSFAPSEIPLAFGVLLLSPMGIITARFLAATFTMFGWRRQPAFKASLNVSSNLAETAVSVAVFRALSTPGDSASPAMFVWLTFSLFVGLVTGSMVVARAIAFIDGEFLVRARNELRHSYLFLLPGALLGGVVALPVLVEPWLSLMFLLPLAAMWLVLRSHGRLLRRFNNLRNIFDFSSLVGRSTGVGEIADTAVLEIADQMRARAVALVAWDRGDGAVHSTSGEPEVLGLLPDRPSDQDWDLPTENDVRLIDPRKDTDELAAALRDRSLGTSLVVTLHGDGQLIGMIVVAGRDGVVNRFTEEDRERLRQVAEQLGVVLRKAQLRYRGMVLLAQRLRFGVLRTRL